MSDILGDAWAVVADLVFFEYPTCATCQPWEGGDCMWLVDHVELEDAVERFVALVAEVNDIGLPNEWETLVRDAVEEGDWACDSCGAELSLGDEIGASFEDEGTDVKDATHLLSHAFWPFLSHYTRAGVGKTAGERLRSILSSRRIVGSSLFIMGKHKVTCLTEASPTELAELLRVSKTKPDVIWERGRWALLGHKKMRWRKDKWGIAIHRNEAVRLGARPAIYADRAVYRSLPEGEKHRFVRFEHGEDFADWTFEREFRVLGDLDLSQAAPDKILVLVPNQGAQLSLLARVEVCPWAVVPFDYPFAMSSPWPRRTGRQEALPWPAGLSPLLEPR